MGASGNRKVPYLRKVDTAKAAEITQGVCFAFGEGCNIVFNNGQEVGRLEYVGEPGPGRLFRVAGKPDARPCDIEAAYIELLQWQGVPVPMMS
jgi:hypothetical protein